MKKTQVHALSVLVLLLGAVSLGAITGCSSTDDESESSATQEQKEKLDREL
jgi:hypothetical protein